MPFKIRHFYVLIIAGVCLLSSAFIKTAHVERTRLPDITLDSTVLGVEVVASKLDVPWELKWGPDNWLWFTEQGGTVSKLNPKTGEKKILLRIPEVYRFRSLGLLGMAIHPDPKTPYVYLDYTVKEGTKIFSKLVRYTYEADTLVNPLVFAHTIPGATGHNGSRVVIAPDGKIILSTGYGSKKIDAQDLSSLNGKILRFNIDGSIPADNPYPNSPIYSSGHRNPQGMAFNSNNGILYSTEHGDAVEDELNIIKKGGNYGWPHLEGYNSTTAERLYYNKIAMVEPLKSWTPVIAPAGIDFYNSNAIGEWKNSILMVTLKTQSLRAIKLNDEGDAVKAEHIYLNQTLGRMRAVCVSPDGDVYVSTSNRDWNPPTGYPKSEDDQIIRLFKLKTVKKPVVKSNNPKKPVPVKKQTVSPVSQSKKPASLAASGKADLKAGALLYTNYCVSCHKADGKGIPGTFPPLSGASQVIGDKRQLIRILVNGLSGPITVKGVKYDGDMPAFGFLSNKDIANVASYIRNNMGNRASEVTVQEVNQIKTRK
jgi:glucose/arabinose dehydrogenase/mono/diheme cytochrome c family protein